MKESQIEIVGRTEENGTIEISRLHTRRHLIVWLVAPLELRSFSFAAAHAAKPMNYSLMISFGFFSFKCATPSQIKSI